MLAKHLRIEINSLGAPQPQMLRCHALQVSLEMPRSIGSLLVTSLPLSKFA